MKVVVADDESRVCALICALIDWEGLGLELVGTAYDGISALHLIEEEKPDLVITDIRMPGLDGLQLIEQSKRIDAHIQFIIISGHKQFDYAQSAIKFGVAEYLLKPIKQTELHQTLLRMRENHIRQTEQQQHSLNLEKQVQQDRDHLRMTAFSSFLEMQDPRMLRPWHIAESCMLVGIVGVQGKERIQVGQLISSKLQDMMSKLPCTPCIQMYKGDIYLLWMYPARQNPLSEAYISQIMDLLKIQTQIFGDLRCTLALGIEAADLEQLKASLLSARQALATRLVKGHGSVYQAQKVYAQHSAAYVRQLDECFAQACAQTNSETLQWCPQVFSEFEKNHEQPYTILESLSTAANHAITFIRDHGNDDLAAFDMESIEQAQSLEEAIQQFHASFSRLHASFLAMQETAIAKPIRLALEYISTHYQDELLSLESVSGIVQLNSSYFSALFKKSVGKGFADYIVDLRIRRAKELLVETNVSIANIAMQIGYRDPKHFAKLFKKCCQIKPNEYRKLYG